MLPPQENARSKKNSTAMMNDPVGENRASHQTMSSIDILVDYANQPSGSITVSPPADFTHHSFDQQATMTHSDDNENDWSDTDSAVAMDIDPLLSFISESDTQCPTQQEEKPYPLSDLIFDDTADQAVTALDDDVQALVLDPAVAAVLQDCQRHDTVEQAVTAPHHDNEDDQALVLDPAVAAILQDYQRKKRRHERRRHRRRERRWADEFYVDSTGHLAVKRDEKIKQKRAALMANDPERHGGVNKVRFGGRRIRAQDFRSRFRESKEKMVNGVVLPVVTVTDVDGEEWVLMYPGNRFACEAVGGEGEETEEAKEEADEEKQEAKEEEQEVRFCFGGEEVIMPALF